MNMIGLSSNITTVHTQETTKFLKAGVRVWEYVTHYRNIQNI